MATRVIIGKDAQVRHTVAGNGYIGVPSAAFLVQPGFDVATSERNWTRTHGVARAGIVALGGPPQVICSERRRLRTCGLPDLGLSHLLDARDC